MKNDNEKTAFYTNGDKSHVRLAKWPPSFKEQSDEVCVFGFTCIIKKIVGEEG